MTTSIIDSPAQAIAHLRTHFVDNGISNFMVDEPLYLRFGVILNFGSVVIQARAEPEEEERLVLVAQLADQGVLKRQDAMELCSIINSRAGYANALILEVPQSLLGMESWLVMPEGQCLAGQIDLLARTYMASVDYYFPLVARFIAGKLDLARFDLELSMPGIGYDEPVEAHSRSQPKALSSQRRVCE